MPTRSKPNCFLQKNSIVQRTIDDQLKLLEHEVEKFRDPALVASALVRDAIIRDVKLHTTVSHTGIIMGLVLTIILGTALGAGLYFYCVVGGASRRAVERIDKYLLGVDSSVEAVYVNPFFGKLTLNRIELKNPPGYESPYLLQATQLHIDIDMQEYFRSRGYHLSIEKLILKDVHVFHEKGKGGQTNTREVIQYLTDSDAPAAADTCRPCGSQETWQDWICRDLNVSLHEFKIQDLVVDLHHMGPLHTVACSDVYYKDYEAEVGDYTIDDLAIFLLRTILKTVLADVADHIFHIAKFTNALATSAEKIKEACPAAISSCLCGVCSSCSKK